MQNIPQSELTPQLRQLVQQALSTHEPLKISIGDGKTAILLAEGDYHQLLGVLNPSNAPKGCPQRVFGSAKGLIKLANDFDAPLDDFKEYR